jgi:hypothetical protein
VLEGEGVGTVLEGEGVGTLLDGEGVGTVLEGEGADTLGGVAAEAEDAGVPVGTAGSAAGSARAAFSTRKTAAAPRHHSRV